MSECQNCTRPTQLFLCGLCIQELRAMLAGLATRQALDTATGRTITSTGYLEAVEDEAHAQTRMSNNPGRTTSDEQPLQVNLRASAILDDADDILDRWCKTISTMRQTRWIPVRCVPPGYIGPLRRGWRRLPAGYIATSADKATWLAAHVRTIALHDQAGTCYTQISRIIARIERTINRPRKRIFLGACPTWIDDDQRVCGRELDAPEGDIEVTCIDCGHTHNCKRLQLLLVNDMEREKVTAARILELNRVLPEEYRIPERTLRRWRRPGPHGEEPKLRARGYQHPDGTTGHKRTLMRDEPLYLWSDVRKLRSEQGKPEPIKTRKGKRAKA